MAVPRTRAGYPFSLDSPFTAPRLFWRECTPCRGFEKETTYLTRAGRDSLEALDYSSAGRPWRYIDVLDWVGRSATDSLEKIPPLMLLKETSARNVNGLCSCDTILRRKTETPFYWDTANDCLQILTINEDYIVRHLTNVAKDFS